MKAGARAVGVAESYRGTGAAAGDDGPDGPGAPARTLSTLAAAVVRADRVVDGVGLATCSVGGTDATGAVIDLVAGLDREDVRYVLIAGVAPAWFNVVDLGAVEAALNRPVVCVSFEDSPGLEGALERAFEGEALAERLDVYRRQPPRHRLEVNDDTVFVRAVGLDRDRAAEVVSAYTPVGGRPEPVRVARLVARAADEWRGAL